MRCVACNAKIAYGATLCTPCIEVINDYNADLLVNEDDDDLSNYLEYDDEPINNP